MPIFCDALPQASELAQAIGCDVRAAESLDAASRSLAGDPAETLVVIGPDTATDEALAFSARLRLERPAVGVVLIRDRVDVALLSRALQSGIREVVTVGDRRALAAASARSRDAS